MNTDNWVNQLDVESGLLYSHLTIGALLSLVLSLLVAVLLGRALRVVVHLGWRLGFDRDKRLAPLGTVAQLVLVTWIGLSVLHRAAGLAPAATFILIAVAAPALIFAISRPLLSAAAGLSLIFRRSVIEGDHIVLSNGEAGIVRRIRLTTTIARTDDGGRLIIPNEQLLRETLKVQRRQGGYSLVLRFSSTGRPSERVLHEVRKLAILSPFRAAGALVSVNYEKAVSEVVVVLRVLSEAGRDSARRELASKIGKLLEESPASAAD